METDLRAVALIVHGGELGDVRDQLEELGVPFAEAKQPGEGTVGSDPIRLLVTTPAHALAMEEHRSRSGALPMAFHVVVADRLSRTVRGMLERSSCDFVVRRPLHPAVLRLLVQRALYMGSEKRRIKRAAIGGLVKVRTGRRSREATLLQLSVRGCGLLSGTALALGDSVTVLLPRALAGESALSLSGQVAGTRPGGGGGHEIAVVFDEIDETARKAILSVMAANAVGSRPLPPIRGERARASRPRARAPAKGQRGGEVSASPDPRPHERRASSRKHFAEPVMVAQNGGSRTLVARDLSMQGMRVERDPGLRLGDELKLALHGDAGLRPVVLQAVVARDDGPAGFLLRFGKPSEAVAARLESLIRSLPKLEARGGGASPGPGVLVSEVLQHR